MKNLFTLFLACVLLCSYQHKPTEGRSLLNEIEKVLQAVDPDVHAGIEVVSLKTKGTLFQKNANHLFVPASSLKIVTGAAALHTLGVDYRFATRLLTDGKKRKHEIKGNLYIKGSGDPELSLA